MKNTFNYYILKKALNLPRLIKRLITIILDIFLCVCATSIALAIRLGELVLFDIQYFLPVLISIFIAIPVFLFCGLYRVIFRYISGDTLLVLTKAIAVYTIIYSMIFLIVSVKGTPRSVGLTQPMILFFLVGSSRWFLKMYFGKYVLGYLPKKVKKGIVIYGIGESGRQLASSLVHSSEFKLLFFISDKESFWGGTIDGFRVKSPLILNDIKKIDQVNEIWLALPNITVIERRRLIRNLGKAKLHVRTLPTFSDLTNDRVHLSDIRELDINDLLERDPVKPNETLLRKCIFKKTVLVTGAGGSIGSELCRQIIAYQPKYIILADHSESAVYNIHQELFNFIKEKSNFKDKKENKDNIDVILVPLLLDIQDSNKLKIVFNAWRPDTVYHAAAYKHVPMVEHNVVSGIKNNVLGTIKCAEVAMEYKVKNFVLISTDKAVRPTNIMGASKRLAEIALQLMSEKSKNNTSFCMVRFGNVLGSSGSVVPLFRKQIESGGPVTLTHKSVTRYFMTITEAAQLVIQAGAMSNGGEVFVLDMGEPIRIYDLAIKMIETAGLSVKKDKTPLGDIEIQTIGLRPGEKLYEELLIGNKTQGTEHSRILQAQENFLSKKDFDNLMKALETHLKKNNVLAIKKLLEHNIYGYSPSENDVDWISKSKSLT